MALAVDDASSSLMAKESRNSPRSALARNVRLLRLDRGLSQENLAAEAAIRQALVSAVEAGSANPTLDSLAKLARALQVDFVELFDTSRK